MAAFASDRRSGWVRVLVLILCALFIFATIATPPAYAAGETVALFGLAAVLSAATAALGFKLANNTEGQATLQKMVQDFTGASIAAGLVLTGTKVNGLVNGMQYIKMAVHNGKTYLDERVAAWCQQWLANNGVYDTTKAEVDTDLKDGGRYKFSGTMPINDFLAYAAANMEKNGFIAGNDLYTCYNAFFEGKSWSDYNSNYCLAIDYYYASSTSKGFRFAIVDFTNTRNLDSDGWFTLVNNSYSSKKSFGTYDVVYGGDWSGVFYLSGNVVYPSTSAGNGWVSFNAGDWDTCFSAVPYTLVGNNTSGLSGTDTLGEDYINKTLDQILQGLKEWAQDWFDAGADSVTNSATGAKDLPLSVTTGAAILNPDVADDGPLVWFPAFGWSLPKLRSGETDTKTVDQGKENASAAETSTVDVSENQTVVNSLVSWALNYIDPDTGLFSKFPLCVPYDAYLLVTSSLGVDAVGSDSIFGASPGDLDGVVTESIDTYSDFQPIININNDFELDGKTYPISISIDLTPWQPLVTFFREGMALLLIAELIGSEYKRIRGH